MEVKGENYCVRYDEETSVIVCEGSLRLYGASGYEDIVKLFNEVADNKPTAITLNLQDLQFLNSSGINAISKFVIKVRNHKTSEITVLGASKFPWQMKSLKNLQRLMPSLSLVIE